VTVVALEGTAGLGAADTPNDPLLLSLLLVLLLPLLLALLLGLAAATADVALPRA
jgi:hypothetical protein